MNAVSPDVQGLVLELPELGRAVERWTSYRHNTHFLTPTDGWSFTLTDDRLSGELLDALRPGLRVVFRLAGTVQGTGYIDRIASQASRSGTTLTIEGRDTFAPLVDACVDPKTLRFKAESSLADIATAVLTSFGFRTLLESNDANRNILTGGLRGAPVTTVRKRPVKSFRVHQVKPYPNETAWTFLERLAGRFGLHLWPTADGADAVIGRPDYTQPTDYALRLLEGDGRNNVLEASADKSWETQPSVLIATAAGYGGERAWSRLKVAMVNEFAGIDGETGAVLPAVVALLKEHPDATVLPLRRDLLNPRAFVASPVARPLFLHDDESKTLEQLEFFVRRRMAELQHKAFSYKATVLGHAHEGRPWAIDTRVAVTDDRNRVDETLWVLARTFVKDRSRGTRTELELVRPYTLGFAEVP